MRQGCFFRDCGKKDRPIFLIAPPKGLNTLNRPRIFLLLLVSSVLFLQTVWANAQNPTPDVYTTTDSPLSLSSGHVEIGIRYSLSGGTDKVTKSTSEHTQVISNTELHKNTQTSSQNVKRKVTQSLNLGFDLAKGLSAAAQAAAGSTPTDFGLTASKQLTDYSEENNDSSSEDTFATSTSKTITTQIEELMELHTEEKAQWGAKDGYISADITLTNSGEAPITIKDIRYSVVQLDGCGGKEIKVVGDGYVPEAYLQGGTVQSTPSTNPSQFRNLEIQLDGKSHDERRLYIPNLATDEILGLLDRPGSVFDVRIISYKIVHNGHDRIVFNHPDGYITIDLVDAQSQYSRVFVKADRPLTLLELLSKMKLGEVKLTNVNGHTIIKMLGGKPSAFTEWQPSQDRGSALEKNQGTWVVANISQGASKDITGPLPPGARLLVAYVTLNDLRLAKRTFRSFNLDLPVRTTLETKLGSKREIDETIQRFGGRDDLLPVACTEKVNVGDEIRITLGSLSESPTLETQSWQDVPLDSNNLIYRSDANWCGAQSSHLADREQPITPSRVLDPYNLSITFGPTNKFKNPISLGQIISSCGFHAFEDGRVSLHFTITEQMLPEKSGSLCFVTPIEQTTQKVGRLVVEEPREKGTSHDLWWAKCGMWQTLDPPRPETKYRYNQHHMEIVLTQSGEE